MFLNLPQLSLKFLHQYFSFFKIFSKFCLEFSSIDKGETAIGRGSRFPLVISTSIRPKLFEGIKIKK